MKYHILEPFIENCSRHTCAIILLFNSAFNIPLLSSGSIITETGKCSHMCHNTCK